MPTSDTRSERFKTAVDLWATAVLLRRQAIRRAEPGLTEAMTKSGNERGGSAGPSAEANTLSSVAVDLKIAEVDRNVPFSRHISKFLFTRESR